MSLFLEATVWDFTWGLLLLERRVKELTLEEFCSDGTLNFTAIALSESGEFVSIDTVIRLFLPC